MGYVIGVGAANVDISGKSKKAIVMRDSNPGVVNVSVGGVTRNILDNLSRLSVSTELITAMGDDGYAEIIKSACRASGIGVGESRVVPGRVSSSYINILGDDGDMFVAVSDMSILEHVDAGYLDSKKAEINSAEAVVCDSGLPADTLEHLVLDVCKDKPVFIDTVSTTYAQKVVRVVSGCHTIKPNLLELGVLVGREVSDDADIERACDELLGRGARRIVVTLGARGCYCAAADGFRGFRALRPLERMQNATGAGDAFTAGLVYGFVRGLDAEATLDFALASGIVTLQSRSTISPLFSERAVRAAIAENRLP